MTLSGESTEEGHGECTKSCNVAGHPHENGLRCKLKRPESHLLEPPLAGLIVHDIPSKRIVGLEMISEIRVIWIELPYRGRQVIHQTAIENSPTPVKITDAFDKAAVDGNKGTF